METEMLSQDMIAKFPAAYAKLARQHASDELELIMEIAKSHWEQLKNLLELASLPPVIVEPDHQCPNPIEHQLRCQSYKGHPGPCSDGPQRNWDFREVDISKIPCPTSWCGLTIGHPSPCEKLD